MNVEILTGERLSLPEVSRAALLRYMRAGDTTETLSKMMEECIREAEGCLDPRVCFRYFPIRMNENALDLGFATVESASLARHLAGCEGIVLLAATLGLGIDRLVARYSRVSPARALCLQALGTERIECLCDLVGSYFATQRFAEFETLSRFSPGYGDLPLTLQREILRALDCPRQIGLSLRQSLLMTPTKSVTAIVGLRKKENENERF